MGFLGVLWGIYTGLLRLVGNILLVGAGIAMCFWATIRQFDPVQTTELNVALFAAGFCLVAFSAVRRVVWSTLALGVLWTGLAIGVSMFTVSDWQRFDLTPTMILVLTVPPVLGAILLELMPKPPGSEGDLEISLSAPRSPDDETRDR